MEKHEDFQSMLRGIQEGSVEAVQRLLDRYGRAILRVIRSRLDERMRSKFDSSDFLQDVWASFFRCPPGPTSFESSEAFCHYLTAMARHKVVEGFRQRLVYQKYNVNREIPLEVAGSFQLDGIRSHLPTPSKEFRAKEEWERATQARTRLQVTILEMLRDGHSHVEIARSLGTSEKLVQRLVCKLAARLDA
jgi:RNA polymerase sigma-70 factor (ECF subfamily)